MAKQKQKQQNKAAQNAAALVLSCTMPIREALTDPALCREVDVILRDLRRKAGPKADPFGLVVNDLLPMPQEIPSDACGR